MSLPVEKQVVVDQAGMALRDYTKAWDGDVSPYDLLFLKDPRRPDFVSYSLNSLHRLTEATDVLPDGFIDSESFVHIDLASRIIPNEDLDQQLFDWQQKEKASDKENIEKVRANIKQLIYYVNPGLKSALDKTLG